MVGGYILRRGRRSRALKLAVLLAFGGMLVLAAWAPAQAGAVTIDSPKDKSFMQNRTPTFGGTGIPLVSLTLSIHEWGAEGKPADEPVTATPEAGGQWQATPPASLPDGPYTAVAEQSEGLVTAKSEVAFTIDN